MIEDKNLQLDDGALEDVSGGVTMSDLNSQYANSHPVTKKTRATSEKIAFSTVSGTMAAIPYSCPHCGASIMVDGSSNDVTCTVCGKMIHIDG